MTFEALLLEASSEILLLLEAQTLHVVAANPVAFKTLGYQPEALIGLPIGEIECALSDLFFWEELAASGAPMDAASSYKCADGSVLEVRKFARLAGTDGRHYQLRVRPARVARKVSDTDITGLHLAATLEATDDGIVLTDIDGSILNMNRRFSNLMALPERLLDERDDHGIAQYIESILLSNPGNSDAPSALSQAIDLKLDLGGDTFETLYLADGRVLECVSHPARDRDRTIGRVFCYRDITQRVLHEQFLQEARDIAEQATLSKGQFLANMSHEIRTPMNAILGMLKLIHATELNERQLDYVNKAEGAAQSLLGLLNDILDFSKIEAGKLELDPQTFSVERVLRELSVILAANLGNKPVELLYDIDPLMPKELVGDAMRLQQVLINLGGNALKFTPAGEVIVHMHVLARTPQRVTLRIGVRDSGIGIVPENQAKIFGDFSQAEASTTRRYGGTGLGLSICKRLVELMGGELTVTSALGKGSNFVFEISMPLPDTVPCEPESDPASPAEEEALEVLVIDDNHVARDLLIEKLSAAGWRPTPAESGEAALQIIQKRSAEGVAPFQVAFVDWEMPGMDGWETVRKLRESGSGTDNPICIMLAADRRQGLAQRSVQEQTALNAFLVKPVTVSMLKEAVAEVRVGKQNFRRAERKAARSGRRLNGMRLLVVEDNLVNQQVARELLMAEGASVELADNGQAAISILTQKSTPHSFDAILMDVQMPVMDGFTATRVIRKDLGLENMPIIAMTANAMASDREDCLEAGMNDHVGKPFDLNYLIKVLLQSSGYQALPMPQIDTPDGADSALPSPSRIQIQPPKEALNDSAIEIDLATAIGNLDGLSDLYITLAQQFIEELKLEVETFHRSVSSALMAEATRQMHTLKGTAATLGVLPLSELAKEIESLCKSLPAPAEVLAREPELARMISASIQGLHNAISRLQQAPQT